MVVGMWLERSDKLKGALAAPVIHSQTTPACNCWRKKRKQQTLRTLTHARAALKYCTRFSQHFAYTRNTVRSQTPRN